MPKPVDITKRSSVQLPSRIAMNALKKPGTSMLDYAKASPLSPMAGSPSPAAAPPNLIANLASKAQS